MSKLYRICLDFRELNEVLEFPQQTSFTTKDEILMKLKGKKVWIPIYNYSYRKFIYVSIYKLKTIEQPTHSYSLQLYGLELGPPTSIQRGRNARPTTRPDRRPVDSLVRSLDQERQAYLPIHKELVERDLDRTPSTYIKCRENPDSAERCPSEAQRSHTHADMI